MQQVHRWEAYLARVIDELSPVWSTRHDKSNHLPHIFDSKVTGCIDTFPILIERPGNGEQHKYYNGKYKAHVVKVSYR